MNKATPLRIELCGEAFFMCRKNVANGLALIAFGLGLLIGPCFSSGFWRFFLAVGVIAVGVCLMRKNRRHKRWF